MPKAMSFWRRNRTVYMAGAAGIAAFALVYCFFLYTKGRPREEKARTDVVASVGDRRILVDDFRKTMARRGGAHVYLLDKDALLDEMISREALLAAAAAERIDQDPEVVRSYHNLIIGRLRALKLEPVLRRITVSDAEAKAYYRDNVRAFTKSALVRLSILFLATHSKMSVEKRSELRDRLEEAREKALALGDVPGFGSLSISYSEDQASRYKGGDIGWMHADGRPSRWPPEVIAAGVALKNIGDLSGIIETDKGFYLVKLSDRREPSTRPLAEVKEKIRQKLLLAKRRDAEEAFVQNARAAVPIKINREVLEHIPVPSPKTARPEAHRGALPAMP